MFYYISGSLALTGADFAVIDCTGVGYKLTVSANTLAKLSGKVGEYVKLYSHFSVREDAQELYGFYTEEEKNAFTLLITVSGIGPKAAMAICSVLTPEKLGLAISTADVKAISAASGVGKKSAERVILELKDKYAKTLGITADAGSSLSLLDEDIPVGSDAMSDAIAVLVSLGYSRSEANYALKGQPRDLDCDGLVRAALNKLMK